MKIRPYTWRREGSGILILFEGGALVEGNVDLLVLLKLLQDVRGIEEVSALIANTYAVYDERAVQESIDVLVGVGALGR